MAALPGTVARGLQRTFATLLGGIVVAAAVGILSLGLATNAIKEFADRFEPLDTANTAILRSALDGNTAIRTFITSGDTSALEPFRAAEAEFIAALDETRSHIDGDASFAAFAALIDQQERIGLQWFNGYAEEVIAARQISQADADAVVAADQGRLLLVELRTVNSNADDRIQVKRQARARKIESLGNWSRLALAVIVPIGVVATWRRARKLEDGLTFPLQRLQSTLHELADGNLDARAPVDGFADVREVNDAFNTMATQIQSFVQRERLERQLGLAVLRHLDTSGIAKLATRGLGEALQASGTCMRWFGDEGDLGDLMAAWSEPGLTASPQTSVLDHPSIVGAWIRPEPGLPDPVAIDDVRTDSRLDDDLRARLLDSDIGSAVLATVRIDRERAIAALGIFVRGASRIWSADELDLVGVVAGDVATALLHARLLEQERSMVASLRELDQAKTDFVSSVSHELRTPLTSIIGYIEMIREGDAGAIQPQQKQMLEIVSRNSDRLLALIEDLLTLARIESGRFVPDIEPVKLHAIVDAAIEAVKPQLDASGHFLEVAVDEATDTVLGDSEQLIRVLMNLLSNAIKFTPAGGRVSVRTEPSGNASIAIAVSDTGYGIPADEQKQLFDRFFRASTAHAEAIQGTGLGLVITKAIVENHDGHISLESEPGRGTTFTVTLPRPEDVG